MADLRSVCHCVLPTATARSSQLFKLLLLTYFVTHLAFATQMLVEMRRIELLTPCLQGRCSPSWATPPNLVDTSLLTNIKSLVIFVCHECPTYGWHHIRLCASLLRQLRCLSLRFASRFHTGTLIRCFTLLRNVSGGPKWTRTTDLTLIRRAL